MYDYSVLRSDHGDEVMSMLNYTNTATNSPTSALAKLLSWHIESPILPSERLLHQADYASNYFCGRLGSNLPIVSDWHNTLKLGFHLLQYPQFLNQLLNTVGIHSTCLPSVVQPGRSISRICAQVAKVLGLPSTCRIVAGTVRAGYRSSVNTHYC